jgi:hypothetical protein
MMSAAQEVERTEKAQRRSIDTERHPTAERVKRTPIFGTIQGFS